MSNVSIDWGPITMVCLLGATLATCSTAESARKSADDIERIANAVEDGKGLSCEATAQDFAQAASGDGIRVTRGEDGKCEVTFIPAAP